MFCIKCGKELKKEDNYCPYCGNKRIEIDNNNIKEEPKTVEQQVIYEEVKDEPPKSKASNLVIYEVILITLGISILMIVLISKMMI